MTDRPGGGLMSNSQSVVDDASLESALADLASVLDIPATPDIANAVRMRLSAGGALARRSRLSVLWPSLRLRSALTFVLLALAALLVVTGVAAAIGFALPGLQIIFSGATPAPATAPATPPLTTSPNALPSAATPTSTAPASQVPLDLGTPTTLAQARTSVTFRVFVPDSAPLVGNEPVVTLDARVIGGEVVLTYPAGHSLPAPPSGPIGPTGQPIGLLVTESGGSVDQGLLGKVLGPDTTIGPVQVNGQTGYWISGRPHSLLILDASGQPVAVTLRDVGDVLVWVQDGTLLRIESPLGLAATLRIAQSMR